MNATYTYIWQWVGIHGYVHWDIHTYVLESLTQLKRVFCIFGACVELFFTNNGINDKKQVAIFLSVIGPKIYALLLNLLALENYNTNQWWFCLKLSRNTLSQNLQVYNCGTFLFPQVRSGQWQLYCWILNRTLTTCNTLPIRTT